MPTTIVIDTDAGVDDAVAIALAARSPELSLAMLTTVAGNVGLPQATANALALLQRLGCDEVGVAAGAARGLVRVKGEHPALHGVHGLGHLTLPAGPRSPIAAPAVRALAELLATAPERSVTLVAIAPLTNVALLLGAEPALTARLHRVVIMGGAGETGNVTPHAEYNAWADPEAAERVLAGGELDVWLVPLEVTRRGTLGALATRTLRTGSSLGADLCTMIDGYADGDVDERPLHDAVVLAAVLEPELVRWMPATVEVDTGDGATRGRTEIQFAGGPGGSSRVHVAVDFDLERWRELLVARLGTD